MKCEECRYWGFDSCPDEVDGKCMKDQPPKENEDDNRTTGPAMVQQGRR